MPFSMVKLSPDNQDSGWQSGYDPSFESIGTFSHIHEWTMAGLGIMPANGPLTPASTAALAFSAKAMLPREQMAIFPCKASPRAAKSFAVP